VKIKTASKDDLEQIVAIYNQAIRNRQTGDITEIAVSDRERWFDDHDNEKFPIFVGEYEERIAAWLSISRYRPGREAFRNVAEISYYVDENRIGHGLGTQIVEHALKYLESTSINVLIAIILGSNKESIEFIRKFGFVEWGRFPRIAEIDKESFDHVYMGRRIKEL